MNCGLQTYTLRLMRFDSAAFLIRENTNAVLSRTLRVRIIAQS